MKMITLIFFLMTCSAFAQEMDYFSEKTLEYKKTLFQMKNVSEVYISFTMKTTYCNDKSIYGELNKLKGTPSTISYFFNHVMNGYEIGCPREGKEREVKSNIITIKEDRVGSGVLASILYPSNMELKISLDKPAPEKDPFSL